MKTSLLLLLSATFLVSGCSKLEFEDHSSSNLLNPAIISDARFNVSIKSAKYYVGMINKNNSKNIESVAPLVSGRDTILYIFNYKDGGGWQVVSADKRTDMILSYSDEGYLQLSTINPGVSIWLNDVANRIYTLKHSSNSDTTSLSYQLWKCIDYSAGVVKSKPRKKEIITKGYPPSDDGYWEYEVTNVEPLPSKYYGPYIKTSWGQSAPWNEYVPFSGNGANRCPAGCVAIAGAQLFYFLNKKYNVPTTMFSSGYCIGYPDNYKFSFESRNSSVWNNMALSSNGIVDERSYNSALLIGYVGHSIGMKYSADGSGAKTEDLVDLFKNEGIDCIYEDYDYAKAINSIMNGIPVILRADAERDTFLGIPYYGGGHAWILSGAESKREQYTLLYTWRKAVNDPDNPGGVDLNPPTREEIRINNFTYAIMNWGWGGISDNGRYNWNSYNWSPDHRTFQWNPGMILGFKPL